MEHIYLTTPIYYVNAQPHIGHAYTTILGDVLARYYQLMGARTLFVTGTDEHGQKVQEAARKRGLDPQAHCDEMQGYFRELWPTLGVRMDDFIRTTEARHVEVVQAALQRLFESGEIYEREYEGWYSPSVERFWADKDLVNGRCPESGGEVTYLKEKNYWFKMSAYQGRLIEHLRKSEDFIVPTNRRNEILGFLERPLQDLCISRPKERLAWGIELPFDRDYVAYVWFDALLNYATAAGLYRDEAMFGQWWPHAVHLLGKDILTTHCVYWNAMLMALGLPLPQHFVAHGWWLIDQTKMSKSLGNVIDPRHLRDVYGVDATRYYLMRDMVLGLDAAFSEEALVQRNNADLANDLGNLVSRATKMLLRPPFDAQVPVRGAVMAEDEDVVAAIDALAGRVEELVRGWKVHAAIEEAMALVRRLNKYVNDAKPFHVVKSDPARAGSILYHVLDGLRTAAICLWPVMPAAMSELLGDLGIFEAFPRLSDAGSGRLASGAPVRARAALFPRFEAPAALEASPTASAAAISKEEVNVDEKKGNGEAPPPETAGKPLIGYDEFAKLELVVVEILEAERVPKSDKLLKLLVDTGAEQRQVVSGIAKQYEPERLVGRRAVLLKNLQPRKVFGIDSQGMLLAASDEDGNLALVTPEMYMPPGSEVS